MSELDILLDKESWLLEIDTDWESGIKEYTWNWDNDEHPPLEEGRKELADLRTRIAELEALTQWQPIENLPYTDNASGSVIACSTKHNMVCEKRIIDLPPHQKVYDIWMPLPKPPEEK